MDSCGTPQVSWNDIVSLTYVSLTRVASEHCIPHASNTKGSCCCKGICERWTQRWCCLFPGLALQLWLFSRRKPSFWHCCSGTPYWLLQGLQALKPGLTHWGWRAFRITNMVCWDYLGCITHFNQWHGCTSIWFLECPSYVIQFNQNTLQSKSMNFTA